MGSVPPRDQELPLCVEGIVLNALRQYGMLDEDWRERRGDDEPARDELQVFLDRLLEEARRHGILLASITIDPLTRKELRELAQSATRRVPCWMDAEVYGPPLMTPQLFVRGLAQLLGEQRGWFERVVFEQVADPEPIERILAEAPVPTDTEDEGLTELIRGVGEAMTAHLQALLDIAHDFDGRLRALLDPGPSDDV